MFIPTSTLSDLAIFAPLPRLFQPPRLLETWEYIHTAKNVWVSPNNFRIEFLILDHCVCRLNISKKELSGKWLIFMITSLALTWLKSNLVSLICLMKNAECQKVSFTILFILLVLTQENWKNQNCWSHLWFSCKS